jgi:hypothetical protein
VAAAHAGWALAGAPPAPTLIVASAWSAAPTRPRGMALPRPRREARDVRAAFRRA